MKAYLYLIALIFLASACEKTADIDVPEIEPKIAVYGFMSASEEITIRLEELTPLFGKNAKDPGPISGATVIIKTNDSTILVSESGQMGVYSNPHLVKAGASYSIEVSKTGFKTVTASCTVPAYKPSSARVEYVATPDIDQDSTRRFGFYWNDKPGEANYYRVSGLLNMDGFQNGEIFFNDQNINDNNKDGQELFSGFGQTYIFSGQPSQSLDVQLILETMDDHLYRYMRTFDAFYFSEDNPFAEPVIMYSNITNGTGVFGGVNKSYFKMDIYK